MATPTDSPEPRGSSRHTGSTCRQQRAGENVVIPSPAADSRQPVLYVITCAAPPARDVGRLVDLAQGRGWDVCVVATPNAARWLDTDTLQAQTGHTVRSEYKQLGTADVLPPPDALLAAPVTVNTVCKWAAGICDTLALGLLVEGIGKGLPVVALPFTNWAHAAHPAFPRGVADLRSWGVDVLLGEDVYPLHDPGTGGQHLDAVPWQHALDTVEQRAGHRHRGP